MPRKSKSHRQSWEQLLVKLADDIEQWSLARNWAVARHSRLASETNLGKYKRHVLHVHTGNGALIVEPVARYVSGADGLINIYGLSTFKKNLLVRQGDKWRLYNEDHKLSRKPWNEKTFIQIAEALTAP